jgi:hypothetical protein
VHKSSAPAAAASTGHASLSSASGSSSASLSLPVWNDDMTLKKRRREAANARSRDETQRRQAKREGREYAAGAASGGEESSGSHAPSDDEIDQLYDEMDQRGTATAAAMAPHAAADDGEVPTSLCMSDAKRKFMQQRGMAQPKQQQQPQSQSRDSQPTAGANASARRPHPSATPPVAAASAAVAAASSSDAAALPAFTSKKSVPALHRGSGVSPVKRPAGSAPPANDGSRHTQTDTRDMGSAQMR